jgi:alkylated DNA nucleotide flippase Atl1
MLNLLKIELPAELATKYRSIAHIHGLPLDARSVTDELMAMESGRSFAPAWLQEKKNGDHPNQRAIRED